MNQKMENPKRKEMVGIKELAKYVGIEVYTVYDWVHQRKIPHYKVGRLLKFDIAEINSWLESKKVEPSCF